MSATRTTFTILLLAPAAVPMLHAQQADPDSSRACAVTQLLPNANPLRTDAVRFTWPFGAAEGELRAYDFGGRMVWRTAVAGGSSGVEWQLADRLANGVYLVVAESAGIRRTFTLFVTRPGR